jgi:3-methylcrotonyl-CoA carboxylase alpha subunit
MEFTYQSGETLRIEREGDHYVVTVRDRVYQVNVDRMAPGEVNFTVEGRSRRAYTALEGTTRYVALDSNVYALTKADTRRKKASGTGENSLTATMPGQVVKILVAEGDTISRGQALVVLEAMKMEIRISAPRDGRVVRLLCNPGQVVERGQVLLELANP